MSRNISRPSSPLQPAHTSGHEVRDLQLVLSAGAVTAIALGVVAWLSISTGVIEIPTPETFWVAAAAGLVALAGWIASHLNVSPRHIAWGILLGYTIIITLAVHYTGGPQTPMPGLYMLVIVAASFVLGPRGANLVAGASVMCYAILLALEYAGVLPIISIWRIPFDATNKGTLLIVNWLALAVPALLTAYLCGSLAHRLKMRNQQLRHMERLRREMVEILAHDLRNPLTVLLGTLDLINKTAGTTLGEEQRNLLVNARRSGQFMLLLIGDMLDMTKLESGRLTLKTQIVDIPSLLADVTTQVNALAEMVGVKIDVRTPADLPPVTADRHLIQRVVANIMSHAIKQTRPGGTISLSSELGGNGCLTIRVRDSSQGYSPEQQKKMFDKPLPGKAGGFLRIGAGLGLTFCKLAVEAHAGEIWVEVVPGEGNTFVVTLPLTPKA